jgi:hypothetical protein
VRAGNSQIRSRPPLIGEEAVRTPAATAGFIGQSKAGNIFRVSHETHVDEVRLGFFSRFFGPPTKDAFAKTVMRTMKACGDPRQGTYIPDQFRIEYSDEGKPAGIVSLHNIYLEYCNAPRKYRATWLRKTCLGLANKIEMPDEFEDVRPDLLPAIKTKSFANLAGVEVQETAIRPIPHQDLTDHLIVTLVYDLPNSMQFVTEDKLKAWDVSWYEALEVARENLDEKQGTLISIGDKVYICASGDAYDAARMLKTDKLRSLTVAGDVVVMPVTRDCLIVTGADDEEGLGIMAEIAEKESGSPRPICPVPARLESDEWRTWLPPVGHPHRAKFHLLLLKYLAGEYSEQKTQLDKRHEDEGPDVFVASFMVMENTDGTVRSFGTWSKGVPTWLPETDLIAFFDPESKESGLVEWERAFDVFGDLFTPLDVYPRRWSVELFPTRDQLEEAGYSITKAENA